MLDSKNYGTRQIWIGCLAAYNSGHLHGEWVDVSDLLEDDIAKEARRILAESPAPDAEEHFIADTSGFAGLIGEHSSFASVVRCVELLDEHGADVVTAFNDCFGEDDLDEIADALDAGAYWGRWDSEQDFAEDLVESTGMLRDCDQSIARYFDYEAFARDLFIDDYVFSNGHVFQRN